MNHFVYEMSDVAEIKFFTEVQRRHKVIIDHKWDHASKRSGDATNHSFFLLPINLFLFCLAK